ncbi:MAG: N-acetylmuramic acid 6-phosphate etherase [Bryobacteraceae bacterium]
MSDRMQLDHLLTEQRNPASDRIDARPTAEILRIINDEDRKVAASVASEIPAIGALVDGIVERMEKAGRLFYIGAGTSGRLGVLDAAECRPTFNAPADLVQGVIAGGEGALARATEASEDDPSAGIRDLEARGFGPGDVLVGIAASGRTPYVLGAIDWARAMGALTAAISCTPHSELASRAEIAITPLPGPEIVTGSTRMKAGTATKLVLNMISTAVMIRRGAVYGNLMVNVQPTNEKLRHRARRIVGDAAGVDQATAAQLLDDAGGSVRTAIVMARLGVDRLHAEQLLSEAGNRVSQVLHRTQTTHGSVSD